MKYYIGTQERWDHINLKYNDVPVLMKKRLFFDKCVLSGASMEILESLRDYLNQ